MEKCPKCGYREGTDWPFILCGLAFFLLYFVFISADMELSKTQSQLGFAAFVLLLAASIWRGHRIKRNRDEYLKLHPSAVDRVKEHFKPETPSNSH